VEDGGLIEAAAGGDAGAFGELVRRHQDVAFRCAYLISRSEADARDAAQEGFVKAYARLPQLRDPSSFRPWLLRIVANEARNRIRSEARWRNLSVRAEEPMVSPAPAAESVVLQIEDHRALLRAVERLRRDDRLVIAFRYFLQLSEAETSEALGWPRGTVKSRLSRAIDRLRSVLGESVSAASTEVRSGGSGDD
jgi:RNA polymerase sigma-70 factor, ECF subfamily